jgi:hypothetical protein
MTAKRGKHRLTRREQLLVYDRERELERRAPVDVSAEILQLQCRPDFDETASRLPYARPEPLRPAVTAETRQAVAEALQTVDQRARTRRLQLAAIASGVLPHTEAWERRRADWT